MIRNQKYNKQTDSTPISIISVEIYVVRRSVNWPLYGEEEKMQKAKHFEKKKCIHNKYVTSERHQTI